MKTKIIIFSLLLSSSSLFAQWNTNGNIALPTDYLGTNNNQPLNIITNGFNRMLMMAGGTTSTDGRVAMGNNLAVGFIPRARLHLHQTSGTNNLRFTTDATGSTSTDGFQIRMSNTGEASFVNHESGANFSWYNRGAFPNSLLGRMRLFDGGVGQTTGRLLIGNNLPVVFTPLDRLHLYEIATTEFTAIRYQNSLTGTASSDGYRTGIDNTNREAKHTQFEKKAIIFESPDARNGGAITNWLHISNGLAGFALNLTDGFIGLNEDSAKFHLDIKTPAINNSGMSMGGELFLSCRTSDAPYSRMGMLNIAGGNGILSATLFGNIDSTQTGSGLNTLAAIHNKQDTSSNLTPVQRFMVGKGWEYNTDPLDAISEIENRNAFSWQNVSNVKMLMNAKGRVKIGNNINLSDTIKNRLVITSSTIDPGLGIFSTMGGSSGLQFTNLTAATPPDTINPGNGLLAVDSMGNVIYVKANNGGAGNYCSDPQNPLTGNYEIPLAGHDFYFSDNISGDGSVAIGDVYCSNNPTATLFVRNTGLSTSTTGIWSESIETAGYFSGNGFGIKARAGALANLSVGVAASANSGNFSVGVYGEANGATNTNYGVRGVAEVVTTARNIGVFGRGRNGSINWGGYFQGDVFCSTGNYLGSDSIIKQNIQPLNQALATLKQLQPKTFEYNPTIHPSSNFPTGIQYGLIAQDVKLVLPGLVKDGFLVDDIDSNGVVIDPGMDIKTLNYNGFIPFLIQGVKELDAQVNDIRDSTIARDSTISRNDSLINDINDRTLSDGTLKNNVTPLTNSLTLIQQLNGINFKWDTLSFPWKNFETDNQIGYIAQDVNNVVPEVVFQDDSGYFHVDYQRLMPLVTEGMKQLDDKNKMLDSINNDLQNQLNDIKACLQNANICNQGNKTSNNAENEGKVIELENLNAIILDQNLPNPFAEKTSINYVIPTDVKEAQLLFYDMNGRIIKQVDITERGEGKLTVYGENLQNGIYTYSLIADGKLIATKKMVKQ